MANEISNRMHAAVKMLGDGTIVARTAGILSAVRTALGVYTVTLVDPIASPAAGPGLCAASYDVAFDTNVIPPGTGGYVCPLQTSPTQFVVRVFDGLGAVADGSFCFTIWRMLSSG